MLDFTHIVPRTRESLGLADWDAESDGIDAGYDTQGLSCDGCALCELGPGFCLQRVIYTATDLEPVVVHGMLGRA